jgi:methionine-rich copper-binding protein CopC
VELASNSDVKAALCDSMALNGQSASQPISSSAASRPSDRRRTWQNGTLSKNDQEMPRPVLPLLRIAVLAGLLAAGCAPVLVAPPHLVAVWPLAGTTLPVAQTTVDLTFNHALRPESTWAAVFRDEDGSPVAVDSAVQPANPRRLSVVVKEPAAGAYRIHWHAVAARTAAEADGEQTFSMQDESAAPTRIQVSPPVADTGEVLQVAGRGFGKHCAVRLTIGDDEQALSGVETDAKGSFAAEARVPQNVPFGEQPVSATDLCGAAATAAVQVRWGGWPPLVAYDVGQAGPGRGEVTFTISLRNRSDYLLERVRVVVPDPPGARLVAADPAPKRQDQSIIWEIPTADRGVLDALRVTYRVGGTVTSRARIEFRHRRPRGCGGDDCLPAFVSETNSESTPVSPGAAGVARTAL